VAERTLGHLVRAAHEGERARHAERLEDPLAQDVGERPARGTRGDQAEDHEAGVAVGPAAARREASFRRLLQEPERLVVADLTLVGPGRSAARLGLVHQLLVVGEPGRVRQQVADRDRLSVRREARKGLGQRFVVPQPPVADEQHDRGGGELLGHRGQPEVGACADWSAGAQIADALRLLEDGAAAAPHEHGEARLVRGDEILEHRRCLRALGDRLWDRREEQQELEHAI
jgi:hypothetical protein